MTPSASHVLVSLLLDAGAQSTLVARVSFWQTLVSWGLDEKQTATSWTLCRTEVESSAVTAERCKTTDIRICSPASSSGNTPHNQHNHIWCSHFSGCFQGGCLGIIFKILAGRLAFHKLQLWQARTTGLKQVAKLQELSCVAIFNGSNLASIQWSGFATGNTLIQISCEVCSLQGIFQTLRFGGSRCGASLSSQVCSKCHCFYRSRSNALLVPQSLSFRLLVWNQASPFLSCDFTPFDCFDLLTTQEDASHAM